MDSDWLSDYVDDEIKYNRGKREQYNLSRKTIQKQTEGINDHGMVFQDRTTFNKIYHSISDDELMDFDVIDNKNLRESSAPITWEFSSINKADTGEQFDEDYEIDDDDNDSDETDETGDDILDAFDSFINSDTSDTDDDNGVQQQQQQQHDEDDNERLHPYTNMTTSHACKQLLYLFRCSQINKFQTRRFLTFIESILPTPNCFPNTMKEILTKLNVETCFDKRVICSLCGTTLDSKKQKCLLCPGFEKKHMIFIYDTHFTRILTSITTRLSKDILNYKEKISDYYNNGTSEIYDIPFASTYQTLLRNHKENFITLLFHLDGIGLCRSTKLKMWIFSSSIIELPPTLRYRRHNMPLMSVWVSCTKPDITMWLGDTIRRLKLLKSSGMFVIITYVSERIRENRI